MRMKQLVLTIFIFCSAFTYSQSFGTGVLVADLNTGIEVYSSEMVYDRPGSDMTDTVVSRLMASAGYNVGAEIGLHKRLGLGLRGRSVAFLKALDEVTNERPDINTSDLLLMVNFHPLVRKKIDLVLGAEMGISRLRVDLNDFENAELRSNGTFLGFYINPRIYYKRVGFNLKTYFPVINYRNMVFSRETPGEFMLSSWKASGFGISAGVQLRLF